MRAWPLPREILRAGARFLREEARVGYRDVSILWVAEKLAADPSAFDGLDDATVPAGELRKRMTEVRGIGPITAAYLAMLRGKFDEIGFDSMSRDFFRRGLGVRSPTLKHAQRRYASFGEWRGLAHALEVMWWWRDGRPQGQGVAAKPRSSTPRNRSKTA
jgi:3-methyladenine DNA glycosylase/8-oxoguanine DNA glycosylase